MSRIELLMQILPDAARDLRLNLQAVLRPENLTAEEVWATALASAFFIGDTALTEAILTDASVSEAIVEDARAAASIMGMNTVYYRFRHLMGKESYSSLPARLRMTRMGQPLTSKTLFELMSLACAALAGCGMCLQAHEAKLAQDGVTEAAIHDVIRIAAVLQGTAVALRLAA